MAVKPYLFEVAEARSFRHPQFPKIQKHTFLVPAGRLPAGIPDGANLREPTGMNRVVYRDVRDSLRGKGAVPGSFDLLNLGITIIAEEVRPVDKRTFEVLIDDEYGIANGGHTAAIIWECQNDGTIAEGQHVEVKIVTGVAGEEEHSLRVDIARGQNTGIAVQARSIFELDGVFDPIKKVIASQSYASDVAFKESDEKTFDIRELVAALELVNIDDFPNGEGKHPISAYEKWSVPLNKYGDDYSKHRDDLNARKYAKFEPLLPDVLALYDIIRRDFLRVHNAEVNPQGAKLKIIEEAGKKAKTFEFPFANLEPCARRLTKGAAYPILAAFRNYVVVNKATGHAEWVGGFDHVKMVWEALAKELVLETREAMKPIGNSPDALGKNRNHWSNLYRTVENHFLREQIEQLQAGRS